jgi:hypothetical protein
MAEAHLRRTSTTQESMPADFNPRKMGPQDGYLIRNAATQRPATLAGDSLLSRSEHGRFPSGRCPGQSLFPCFPSRTHSAATPTSSMQKRIATAQTNAQSSLSKNCSRRFGSNEAAFIGQLQPARLAVLPAPLICSRQEAIGNRSSRPAGTMASVPADQLSLPVTRCSRAGNPP